MGFVMIANLNVIGIVASNFFLARWSKCGLVWIFPPMDVVWTWTWKWVGNGIWKWMLATWKLPVMSWEIEMNIIVDMDNLWISDTLLIYHTLIYLMNVMKYLRPTYSSPATHFSTCPASTRGNYLDSISSISRFSTLISCSPSSVSKPYQIEKHTAVCNL